MNEISEINVQVETNMNSSCNGTPPDIKTIKVETNNETNSTKCNILHELMSLLKNEKENKIEIIDKIFKLTPKHICPYLMQIIHLYLYQSSVTEHLFTQLSSYTNQDLHFSLLCTWFLEAYLIEASSTSHACVNLLKRLLNSILGYFCEPDLKGTMVPKYCNLLTGFISERCFITELVLISRRLCTISTKSNRTHRLHSELLNLDRSISQIAFIPIASWPRHVVVRIPFRDCSVLNSKDKSPYLLYVEVIEKIENYTNFDGIMSIRKKEFEKIATSSVSNDDNTIPSHSQSLSCPADMAQVNKDTLLYDVESDILGTSWKLVSMASIKKRIDQTETSSVAGVPDDPSANILSEPWKSKIDRIQRSSPYGNILGWNLYAVIVKYGDDLRQDFLAYQFLNKCKDIWEIENVQPWVKPYCVVITETHAGIIEAITDAVSIHQIKCKTQGSLEDYFKQEYGDKSEAYINAKNEFIKSLAGYSLFQYIFQVKDRHNGNILVDLEGHVIHIDFGFILGQSPKNISFETSPFKISHDFMQLLEGVDSEYYAMFKNLMHQGFRALRKHMHDLMTLVDVMKIGITMSCLGKNGYAVEALRNRFAINLDEKQLEIHVDKLIYQSVNSITTVLYDKYQYYTNGIRI